MIRIQRRRAKGWQLPEGAMYVGRPTRWGNPFDATTHTCQWAVDAYRVHLASYFGWEARTFRRAFYPWPVESAAFLDWLAPLRDATALACWCPLDQPCHADVLIELLAAA